MSKEKLELRVVDDEGFIVFEAYRSSLKDARADIFFSPLEGTWRKPMAAASEAVARTRDRFNALLPMPKAQDEPVVAVTQYLHQLTDGLEGVGDNPTFCNNVAREIVQIYQLQRQRRGQANEDYFVSIGRSVTHLLGFEGVRRETHHSIGARIHTIIQ